MTFIFDYDEMPKSCAFCEGKALDHYCVVTGRITTALLQGIPQSEIARNEGVSRQLVSAIAKKLKKETK